MTDHTPEPPSPTDPPDWEALARYVAGESAPDEAAAVRGWLASHPEDAQLLGILERNRESIAQASTDLDVEGALERVTARIRATEVLQTPNGRPSRSVPGRIVMPRRRWSTAGWVGLAAAAGIVALLVGRSRPTTTPAAVTPTQAVAAAPHIYTTPVGRRDSVTLADGSRVILGPDSRLTVPADYGATQRSVELQGVAFFSVQHDAAHPFSIHDANATIEDIGTTFVVENEDDGGVAVSVETGSVRLRAANAATDTSGVVLAAGDHGLLDNAGQARRITTVAAEADTGWMSGRIVLRDATLQRVAGQLHRWYGIDLRTDSSLAGRHVTATFTTEPVDVVLRSLSLSLGASVQRRGDTAILRAPPKGRD